MKKLFSFIFFILLTCIFTYCQTQQATPDDKTEVSNKQAETTEYTKIESKKQDGNAMDKRLRLKDEALKYLGTPYVYQGTSSAGFDCSGLVYRCTLDVLSIELPHKASGIASCVKRLPDNTEPQVGDFLFFNTTGKGIGHVGIYIGEGKFVHAASQGPRIGVIISSLSENYWKRCFLFYGTIFES